MAKFFIFQLVNIEHIKQEGTYQSTVVTDVILLRSSQRLLSL